MYPVVLFLHLLSVMSFFGMGAATDAALVQARKHPEDGAAIRRLVLGRNLRVELITGVLALVLGIALLMVNPAGMGIMRTGSWIHLKLGAAIVAIVMVLASHRGVTQEAAARWVVPVRGVGFLFAAVAVFAVTVLKFGAA